MAKKPKKRCWFPSVRPSVAKKSKWRNSTIKLAENGSYRFSGVGNPILKSVFQKSKIFEGLSLKNWFFKPESLILTAHNFFVRPETDFRLKGRKLSWIKGYRLVYTLSMLFSSPEGLQSGKNFQVAFLRYGRVGKGAARKPMVSGSNPCSVKQFFMIF